MPKNCRLFAVLFDEMSNEQKQLYFTTRLGGCREVMCSQDCLIFTKNWGFAYEKKMYGNIAIIGIVRASYTIHKLIRNLNYYIKDMWQIPNITSAIFRM